MALYHLAQDCMLHRGIAWFQLEALHIEYLKETLII
jgi:hypothetical protein